MLTKALEAPTMFLEEGAVANGLRTAFVCKRCNSEKITIVQHPELRKGLCTYPTLVCEDYKASTPIFFHMLVKVIGMLLNFNLLLRVPFIF